MFLNFVLTFIRWKTKLKLIVVNTNLDSISKTKLKNKINKKEILDEEELKKQIQNLEREKWLEGLREVEGYDPETGLISFSVPVDEYRSLCVKLRPLAPDMPARYEIIEDRVQITPRNGE